MSDNSSSLSITDDEYPFLLLTTHDVQIVANKEVGFYLSKDELQVIKLNLEGRIHEALKDAIHYHLAW